MSEVVCKGCGEVIRALVPSEQAPEPIRRGGQVVLRERGVLACDGSKHVTCMCMNCADKLNDPKFAEAMYCMDLETWATEGDVHPAHIERKVDKVLRVDGVIQ
jgi:hypothetical protein